MTAVKDFTGKSYAEEGVRKLFRKANLAIYNATGVYFLHSSIGLMEEHDIPTDTTMASDLEKAGLSQSKASKQTKAARKPNNTCSTFDGSTITVSAVTVVLQPRGRAQPEQRYISEEVAKTCGIHDGQQIACSGDVFDRWYSCLCFGLRHSLPKRVYLLWQSPEGHCEHRDNGVPPVTIHTLLETYCLSQLMQTTDVSDMILDELLKVFQNEKILYAKYKGRGRICEGDPNEVVRFMDLEPEDIELLWANTTLGDPIRSLVVDLLTHDLSVSEKKNVATAVRLRRRARELYYDFVQKYQPHEIIDDFASTTYAEHFCAAYHNHAEEEPCYAWRSPSAQSKEMIDNTTTSPSTQSVEIAGVASCKISNNTGGPFDIEHHHDQHPGLVWKKIRSFNSWIIIPHEGPQRREPYPVYVDEDEFDEDGRWPTHPGYNNSDWTPPADEEEDNYKEDWDRAKHQEIPRDARKKRVDDDTGEVTFEIPDEDWYPPRWFDVDRERARNEPYHEWQRYRREEWIAVGNANPYKKCVRFRPFEESRLTLWTDPFTDRQP